ncbi:unnamed protein product, partial [Closterium sp. Naga37s-1]
PPGYYFRPGFGHGASSWHIHLPPGGWCSSLSGCANRSTTFLGSSKPELQKDNPYSNASYAYLGILSTGPFINKAFRNWNLVVPIYCDGGGFSGTAGWARVNGSFGIYMDGWSGIKAVLTDVKELRGMQSAERVLLSGQSAGAQTVLSLCEHMQEYAPNARTIKCLMDSGSFTGEEWCGVIPTIAMGSLSFRDLQLTLLLCTSSQEAPNAPKPTLQVSDGTASSPNTPCPTSLAPSPSL